MASTVALAHRENQSSNILEERNSHVKLVILDRPEKLNALKTHMIFQLWKALKKAETDPTIKLVIVKGKGSAFCVGGDVTSTYSFGVAGHWTFATQVYAKALIINYVVATYKKPLVFLINGLVMGAGAGLSMFGRFKVITEKAVFAMPEAALGLFPDIGESYFLSNLPGFFGEYLGLTGIRLDGSEILACGLATHFVHSKIREGRMEDVDECLVREHRMVSHLLRKTVSNDFYEGVRSKLFDKGSRPKWEPSKLELVSNDLLDKYYTKVDEDEGWEELQLPCRSNPQNALISKL